MKPRRLFGWRIARAEHQPARGGGASREVGHAMATRPWRAPAAGAGPTAQAAPPVPPTPQTEPPRVAGTQPADGDAINLRLLVIAADAQESNLAAITALLDRLDTPYDVLIAGAERLTAERLWQDNHAFYHGIILTTGNLGYQRPHSDSWQSAFDDEQWSILWRYEARFGIRQVTCFTVPGGYPDAYGLSNEGVVDTGVTPLAVQLTGAGKDVFWYLNAAAAIPIQQAWTYLSRPTDQTTTALLVGPDEYAVAAVHRYADGRENLALTIMNNPSLLHFQLLGYGLVTWVTRGLFLGERHVYLSPQVDDIFFRTQLWAREPHAPARVYRLAGADIQGLVGWLDRLRAQERNCAKISVELAFNGEGAVLRPAGDTLVPSLVRLNERFNWVNHSFRHPLFDEVGYTASAAEIHKNNQVAALLKLRHYHTDSLVTPEISGLSNAEFMRAARDVGIKYLVSDTSRQPGAPARHNAAEHSSVQPELLVIPRHPNNLFFNVATPDEWCSEYQQLYHQMAPAAVTFEAIVEREAATLLRYLLTFDIAPLMFHQANLHVYDGRRSLFSALLDRVLELYNALIDDLPICSRSLHEIGETVVARAQYRDAAVQATLFRTQGLLLQADRDVVVPVTGAVDDRPECYGRQWISEIRLAADTPHWIPLPGLGGFNAGPVAMEAPSSGRHDAALA